MVTLQETIEHKLLTPSQNLETAFKKMGYKVQTHELSHFHDDYGLKTGDDEDDAEEDDDEEEDYEDGSDDGSSESADDDKI